MRNSILVKNNVFFNTTVKENNCLIKVNALQEIETAPEIIHETPVDMFVSNNQIDEVTVSASSIVIYDKTNSEDEHLYGVVTHVSDNVLTDIIPAITAEPIHLNIVDSRPFSIVVIKPQETYQELKSIPFYIFDKYQELEMDQINVHSFEFSNIYDISRRLQDVRTQSNSIIVNTTQTSTDEYEYILNPSILNTYIQKKQLTEYTVNTEMAISITTTKKIDGYTSMPVIEIDIANNMNSADGSNNNSGGDLKSLIFTIQQLSFFEFKLKFEKNKVKEVFNLPTGLFFDIENQRIVGTPFQSGKYSFSIIFEDNSSLDGVMTVPKVNREL